jgi:hypothetical protein
MRKRRSPSKSSFDPYVPSAAETDDDEKCLLCGDLLEPWPAEWCELVAPEERIVGFAHTRCVSEYNLFAAQMPFAAVLSTPLF